MKKKKYIYIYKESKIDVMKSLSKMRRKKRLYFFSNCKKRDEYSEAEILPLSEAFLSKLTNFCAFNYVGLDSFPKWDWKASGGGISGLGFRSPLTHIGPCTPLAAVTHANFFNLRLTFSKFNGCVTNVHRRTVQSDTLQVNWYTR